MIANSKTLWRWTIAIAFALATPAFARADGDTPKAIAERLFLRGKELMATDHYEEACVAFDESLRVQRAGGTLLNLAECYVALGRYASAASTLGEARQLAEAAHRDDAAAFAAQRLAEVTAHVDHLRVHIRTNAPRDLVLSLDQVPLGPEGAQDNGVPIDPGAHVIHCVAPGVEPTDVRFEIHGEKSDLVVEIPELRGEAPTTRREPRVGAGQRIQPIVGWSVATVGIAGLLTGSALGVAALVEWNDAKSKCPTIQCSDLEGVNEATSSKVLADGSTLALGVGAAATALGVVLVLVSPKSASRNASAALRVGPRSLSLEGSF